MTSKMSILPEMNHTLSKRFSANAIRGLFAREFRAALINRYLQVFCALALAGGMAAAVFSEDANATGFYYLQIALVGLLMLNPLDAFRINALFALQQIPAEAANKTPLAAWWIAHAGAWFAAIVAVWSIIPIAVAGFRLNRWEE
jgi:hypothetical protein